jgi:gluconate 5-dehydrogenase
VSENNGPGPAAGPRAPWNLSGRRAVVTGGSAGGLGHHFALALARAGADVAVLDRPGEEEPLGQTAEAIRREGRASAELLADITDETQVAAEISRLTRQWGDVHILVNGAGVMLREPALDSAAADWRRVVDVNLTGTWLVSRVVARHMSAHGWGRIVNVSTQYAAQVGPMHESAYYASKAGVANLTRSLASEWAAYGINVNCLAPGAFYPTRMTAGLADVPGRLEYLSGRTMLGRLGNVTADLDGPVVFLASDASSYVTGSVLYVDGGWTAW